MENNEFLHPPHTHTEPDHHSKEHLIAPRKQETLTSFFNYLPPKTAFFFGCITTVLVLGTIGFFVLGSYLLRSTGNPYENTQAYQINAEGVDNGQPEEPAAGSLVGVTPEDHIRGEKNAELTIIEYSDIQCPYCARFHIETMQEVMKTYGTKVRWIYRHFPLTSLHPQAKPAAIASECANEQGKFWEFLDVLFGNQSELGDTFYKQTASNLGLDGNKFATCLASGKYDEKIDQQIKDGAAAGVTGTPGSFFIDQNGSVQPIKGALPLSYVQSLIDQSLGQ